jgi:pyridoxal 5'-phosphate synthase pdxT subunit
LAEFTTVKGEVVTVAVRQGPLLASAFHPELTADLRWHEYFVGMVEEWMVKDEE